LADAELLDPACDGGVGVHVARNADDA
jgi:hypothetical protein